MNSTDKSFSAKECALLASLIGKTLTSLNACIVARDNMAWNTVRLHCKDFSVDINNELGELILDEFGSTDEFGLMNIIESDSSILSIPGVGAETTVTPIDKTIHSISVAYNSISIFDHGEAVSKLRYPQAVAFDLGNEYLVLDKETWFEETISIKTGAHLKELIYDDSDSWIDDFKEDPSTHYEYNTELEKIK